MSGRVADIQQFCIHDGPGIRTLVFLQGCPLRCAYCHNPRMQSEQGGTLMSAEEVLAKVVRDKPFFDSSGGGMTLSGGEPLMQPEFCIELCQASRGKGISVCIESSGAASIETISTVAASTDMFLWDVKFADTLTDAPIDKLRAAEHAGAAIRLRSVLLPGADKYQLKQRLLDCAGKLSRCDRIEILPYNDLHSARAAVTP